MSESSWQHTVAAARVKKRSLFFVNHKAGGTIETTTSKEAALQYIREAARPHLYVCLEQVGGALYEVTK